MLILDTWVTVFKSSSTKSYRSFILHGLLFQRENACAVTRARRTGTAAVETSVNAPKHRVTAKAAKSSAAALKKNAAAERDATDRKPVNVPPNAAVRRSMTPAQRHVIERKLRRNISCLLHYKISVYL